MAEAAEILELRGLINEPTQVPYTDDALSLRIDTGEDLRVLASTIWREKAARYAGLVDMKEGNSDRKLSQLHKHALNMAEGLSVGVVTVGRRIRTRKIERQ